MKREDGKERKAQTMSIAVSAMSSGRLLIGNTEVGVRKYWRKVWWNSALADKDVSDLNSVEVEK